MSFSSDINKFTLKVKDNGEKVIRGTALALFSDVVVATPVDTGRLRGDWQVTVNTPANSHTEIADKSGAVAIKAITGQVFGFRLGSKLYLINTLPYAKAIEEGHSRVKAPAGMVRVSIADFQREISKQARKVR